MTEPPSDSDNKSNSHEIRTEKKTEISHSGEGTVYAILTVEQGKRRVDWKIGHIDGTFAEGFDNYYDGDLFFTNDFTAIPENAPSGKYKDDKIYRLEESDASVEDGEVTITEVYDTEGIDATEWALDYFDTMLPETIIDEWWREDKAPTSGEGD